MYGDLAHKLILEAKRAQSLDFLPTYPEDYIQGIVRETRELNKEADYLLMTEEDGNRVTQCQLFVIQLCMRRNKRCLMAHAKLRADKMDLVAWDGSEATKAMLDNLSHQEQEYFRKYNELASEYKGLFTDLDLGGPLEPPEDVFVDVRVLKDAGEVQTEYGVFNLTKGSQFFVRQADVERLIQQGYVKKL
ncbi:unnamed protein product [Kuraishia capsulata CBS 1993]|uniref:DNA replication complex GINS protein PSF1 n=1 Tax=Kuraishia capsulata CBS 1993 TaxID=1382522 RepID=W6MQ34_9ASCO|nr:uncharacterized protein KUCA_T00004829001 [Kuraishia capsulata CBS 1993]CDK28844.1 unnamed protein product [Kuraishia capsulata CBS 1993]